MRAKNGVYDTKAGSLHLTGGVEISSAGGYLVLLQDALVEIRKGHIVTRNPVRAAFPEGTLEAQRLEIFDHGDRARFDGGVVVTLRPPPPGDAKTAETK
jgi:lipopolysaccharide export system protein LptC